MIYITACQEGMDIRWHFLHNTAAFLAEFPPLLMGDLVALLVRHWTHNPQVTGSNLGWALLHSGLWQATYNCVPVTKQYNLVPAKRCLCTASQKVTIGLASHCPCVADLVVYPLRQMSTPPMPLKGYGCTCFFYLMAPKTHKAFIPIEPRLARW